MQLVVNLTDGQYIRYKAALKKVAGMDVDPTDEQLIAQLMREAAAITYAAESSAGVVDGWTF